MVHQKQFNFVGDAWRESGWRSDEFNPDVVGSCDTEAIKRLPFDDHQTPFGFNDGRNGWSSVIGLSRDGQINRDLEGCARS